MKATKSVLVKRALCHKSTDTTEVKFSLKFSLEDLKDAHRGLQKLNDAEDAKMEYI